VTIFIVIVEHLMCVARLHRHIILLMNSYSLLAGISTIIIIIQPQKQQLMDPSGIKTMFANYIKLFSCSH